MCMHWTRNRYNRLDHSLRFCYCKLRQAGTGADLKMSSDFNDRDFSLKKKKRKKVSKFRKLLSYIVFILAMAAAVAAVMLVFFLKDISRSLPSSYEILAHQPSLTSVVYDRNNRVVANLFQENRTWVKLEEVSPWMVKAVLAAEDDDFYDHSGIKFSAILRALIVDVFHGTKRQGGSTITQQLARNLFLSREKTLVRKAKEAILAIRLEKIYSKDQLLEMYLNTVYFGHGAYGIDSASRNYFGKSPAKLTIGESAMLSGLLVAPETYTPYRNPTGSNKRKNYVLGRMLDLDWISKANYEKFEAELPKLVKRQAKSGGLSLKQAPYFVSHILFKHLLPTYGTEKIYRGGLAIHTTIDMDLQKKAEELVSKMSHEGALVAIDPNTGEVLALVGGRDFEKSKFNRATQAFRQPGSAFKPIVYATAVENGYRPVDHVLDAPLTFPNGWSPGNYSGNYSGEMTLTYALAKSVNTVAVRVAQIVGVNKIIEMSRKVGITTPYLPDDLSLALGTASVTPLEMCAAYSVFANNGYKVEPFSIKEILAKNGDALEQTGPNLMPAMSPATAATMRSMLEQVAIWGTGAKARIPNHETFGKTGTTNDWTDAWFVGGIPGLVVVVYVGNDNHKPLGGRMTGTVAAVPVWKEFVTFAAQKLKLPQTFIVQPDIGVESVRLCQKTGFLASDGCEKTINLLVPLGHAPMSVCPWHGGSLLAAREDLNAPQLLLAPIDDISLSTEYAMVLQDDYNYYDDAYDSAVKPKEEVTYPYALPEPAAPAVPAPVTVKKPKVKETEKVPKKEEEPYKKDPSDQDAMEKRYQELLKEYNIID